MEDRYPEDNDRRQSVRVTGRNLFYFQSVSPERFAAILKDFEMGIAPYNQEGLADIQMFIGAQSALVRIRERDSDLGDFLSYLDTKINVILKETASSKTLFDRLSLYELNLSGRGVSFVADRKVAVDEILEFHITLLPTYIYVYCFGKVISCKELPPQEGKIFYKVAAEFVLIMEDDQEKLIQHNFKQQSQALRNRRMKG